VNVRKLCGAAGALMVLLVLVGPPAPAWAEDPEPFARSAATTYQVTLAARGCGSYADVVANQVRDDAGESPGRPGHDSPYKPGQPVDPDIEERAGCEPLPGVSFVLGSGREKKGPLSSVTGAGQPVTTLADTPRLDPTGQPSGGPLRGAITVALTEDQMNLAGKRQLWVQGGTPATPVPTGSSFAVLRCGIDGRTGGNTQWIGYPTGVRHVFCFAYYVRGATATGTLTVKLRTSRAVGYPQRVPFASTLSQSGTFALTADSSETSFVRLSGEPHRLQPQLPAGWALDDATCAASSAQVDAATGRADVTLVAGENVTCSYVLVPPAAPSGLTLRAFAEGGAGAFGLTVAAATGAPSGGSGGSGPVSVTLTAAPRGDGSAVTATGADLSALPAGQYTVSVTLPAADAAQWSLAGASCNGAPVSPRERTVAVTVGAGAVTDCVLRLVRKQGTIALKVVSQGGVAAAGFGVAPARTSEAGWWAAGTTTRSAAAAPATGDVPASLPFGSYLVTPVPPLATVDSAWKLTSLGCSPGTAAGPDAQSISVDLTASAASVECTATYEIVKTTELRLRLEVDSGSPRPTAVALEVTCVDGSTGRVVIGGGLEGPADLPRPLVFASETTCTVSLAEGTDRPVNASLVNESAAGNAPLPLPATVPVAVTDSGSAASAGPDDLRLSVVLSYNGAGIDERRRSGAIDSFGFLPVALIGSGLIGIGAAVLLVLVARRRMGLD
jgi:hypothetical protein